MKNKKNNSIFDIWKLLLSFKKRYLVVIFLLATMQGFIPFTTMLATQALINAIQIKAASTTIAYILMWFALFSILEIITNLLFTYYQNKYREYLYLVLNCKLLRETQNFRYVDFENSNTYDLIDRADQQIGIRPINIVIETTTAYTNVIAIISSFLILIIWKPWTIIGFLILPFMAFKYFKEISNTEYKTIYNRTKYERHSWYITYLLTKDIYIKEIRVFNLFTYLFNHFIKLRTTFYHQNLKLYKRKTIFSFCYQLIDFIFTIVVVIAAIQSAFSGEILVGNLMTYINTTSKLDNAVQSLTTSLFSIYQDSLYSKNIIDFLEFTSFRKKINIKENNHKKIKIKSINSIEFKNVSFKYPGTDIYALKNITFKADKGKTLALVGKNGSGKTTLIKILAKLYENYTGKILINSINLKDIDDKSYSSAFSAVFQDFNNYQYTVRENVGFGDLKDINNNEHIYSALKKANVNKVVDALPNKINQALGTWFEGSIDLSGGQWQKLALARGLMKKVNLYILDEPTAALDPQSEYIFFKRFIESTKGCMSFYVTHRFTNVKFADEILVLDKGKIVQRGTHNNLIKQEGLYKQMFDYQTMTYKR
uniref:ABC transporter ATP-binding protein n=1 Tax=Lactobacillus acidophilus TaxID=1579 RepID=UPI003F564175